ncbi:MAG: dockerin type I domain-containing protein [Acidobacteriota bacterium]
MQAVACGALLALAAGTGAVRAGGAFLVNGNGEPLVWDTTAPIVFNPDQGPLGQLDESAARQLVMNAFNVWGSVRTSSVSFAPGEPLPCDVNLDTVLSCGPEGIPIFGDGGDGLSPVVFDTDGSILDLFFGLGARNDFIGIAVVAGGSYVPPVASEAEALINGRFFDGIDDAFNPESSGLRAFEAVMVHEFGHWLNLDHSQLNLHVWLDGDAADDRVLPTMFPASSDDDAQLTTLNPDDIAALTTLYPLEGHLFRRPPPGGTPFGRQPGAHPFPGRVSGTIFESDGVTPFAGANVVLRRRRDPEFFAYSAVSGARFRPAGLPGLSLGPFGGPPDETLRGRFDIAGVRPGSYTLEIEEISPLFTGSSAVGPLLVPVVVPGPDEYWNGGRESADPAIDRPGDFVPLQIRAASSRDDVNVILNDPPRAAVLYVVDDEPFAPRDLLSRGAILELDLATGEVLNRIPTAARSSQLSDGLAYAASRGSLFWTDGLGESSIFEIDPADGTVLGSFPWPDGAVSIDGLAFLDGPGQPAGGILYALDSGTSAVLALTPDTGELQPDLSLLFPTTLFGGLGGKGDDLFVTTLGAFVIHVRPAAVQPFVQSFIKPGLEQFLLGVAYDGDILYAASILPPEFRIWQLDPTPAPAAGRPGSGLDVLSERPDPTNIVLGGFSAAALARPGDLDGNAVVNGFDLAALSRRLGARDGETRYRAGADLNRDGRIDATDLNTLLPDPRAPHRARRR